MIVIFIVLAYTSGIISGSYLSKAKGGLNYQKGYTDGWDKGYNNGWNNATKGGKIS